MLANPERIEPDKDDVFLEHRLGVIAENGGRVLRVIVNTQVDSMRVVTVYFDRTKKGKL